MSYNRVIVELLNDMPTNRRRVQTYVSPTTYAWLEAFAEEQGKSLSEVVSELLQTVCVDGVSISTPAFNHNNPYVTREEIDNLLHHFWERVTSLVVREIASATATQSSIVGMLTAAVSMKPDQISDIAGEVSQVLNPSAENSSSKSKSKARRSPTA